MKRWISDLSTTNFRIVVSLSLAVLLVVVLLAGVMFKIELQGEIVWGLFAFVGAMLGIDVSQFSIKRKTELVTPPMTTADHATATTVATVPAAQPVGRPHPNTNPAIVAVLETAARVPNAATAIAEAEEPQTGTVAAAHAFDPGA